MQGLTESQLLLTLLALAVVVCFARAAGEVSRRLHQPEVLGELFAGFLLGPSVLGAILPDIHQALFLTPAIGQVLSAFSWVGAILLLLLAGIEVDLGILRSVARPGAFAAVGAIVPSLLGGAAFALVVLGRPLPYNFYLGIVLSVTAVSVVAKLLMERETVRREYAQVMLAAGVSSEVVVWLLVSVASATKGSSPTWAALRSLIAAVAFFAFVVIIGKPAIFWAMRRVNDSTHIARGQLSLILVLTFLAASLTQALGLHALLGAFVVGVVLSRAPRTNRPLLENLQTLTTGFFAPIFFVLAGMRVNIFELRSWGAAGIVLLLFVFATVVKVTFATAGARLGGLRFWESALVGVGLNLKGGTDVIVAIVGVELGLLSGQVYTMYALMAMVTVLISPSIIGLLERRTPPSKDEVVRLEHEAAGRRAYMTTIERVLVPVGPHLYSDRAASLVRLLAQAKKSQDQIFDVTELVVKDASHPAPAAADAAASDTPASVRIPVTIRAMAAFNRIRPFGNVEVREEHIGQHGALRQLVSDAADYDLVTMGAIPPTNGAGLSFGRMQDAVIYHATTSVLVTLADPRMPTATPTGRILVPLNGLEYSLAAADVAAHLAKASGASITFLYVTYPTIDAAAWHANDHRRLLDAGQRVVDEGAFRAARLEVKTERKLRVSPNPSQAILEELQREQYDLLVLGAVDRGQARHFSLGRGVEVLLTQATVPIALLIARQTEREAA